MAVTRGRQTPTNCMDPFGMSSWLLPSSATPEIQVDYQSYLVTSEMVQT